MAPKKISSANARARFTASGYDGDDNPDASTFSLEQLRIKEYVSISNSNISSIVETLQKIADPKIFDIYEPLFFEHKHGVKHKRADANCFGIASTIYLFPEVGVYISYFNDTFHAEIAPRLVHNDTVFLALVVTALNYEFACNVKDAHHFKPENGLPIQVITDILNGCGNCCSTCLDCASTTVGDIYGALYAHNTNGKKAKYSTSLRMQLWAWKFDHKQSFIVDPADLFGDMDAGWDHYLHIPYDVLGSEYIEVSRLMNRTCTSAVIGFEGKQIRRIMTNPFLHDLGLRLHDVNTKGLNGPSKLRHRIAQENLLNLMDKVIRAHTLKSSLKYASKSSLPQLYDEYGYFEAEYYCEENEDGIAARQEAEKNASWAAFALLLEETAIKKEAQANPKKQKSKKKKTKPKASSEKEEAAKAAEAEKQRIAEEAEAERQRLAAIARAVREKKINEDLETRAKELADLKKREEDARIAAFARLIEEREEEERTMLEITSFDGLQQEIDQALVQFQDEMVSVPAAPNWLFAMQGLPRYIF